MVKPHRGLAAGVEPVPAYVDARSTRIRFGLVTTTNPP